MFWLCFVLEKDEEGSETNTKEKQKKVLLWFSQTPCVLNLAFEILMVCLLAFFELSVTLVLSLKPLTYQTDFVFSKFKKLNLNSLQEFYVKLKPILLVVSVKLHLNHNGCECNLSYYFLMLLTTWCLQKNDPNHRGLDVSYRI